MDWAPVTVTLTCFVILPTVVCRMIVASENKTGPDRVARRRSSHSKKHGTARAESSQGHGRVRVSRRAMRTSEQCMSLH